MFLEASVSHSVHVRGLCMMSFPVWLPGPMFVLEGVSVPGPMFHPEGGFCPGGICPWGLRREAPPRIRKVGGMHPTGILSCYTFKSTKFLIGVWITSFFNFV